ncbi:MAG TPA: hypothetical protein VLX91_15515 [Candidatus Acidoferrales bacterium]|nr:hypothetical protein [Candidatus Acidoferrales bacterium]
MKYKFLLRCFSFISLSTILYPSSGNVAGVGNGGSDSTRPSITNAIQRLEKAMKFKFALGFLISHRRLLNLEYLEDSDTTRIRMERNLFADNLIERFEIADYTYDLWKVNSMRGDKEYYLLTDSTLNGTGELDLFLFEAGQSRFCDSLQLSSRDEGLYQFTQLNNHSVIKVERAFDATGYYREDEAFVGISDEKFQDLFDFIRLEFYRPEDEENAKWKVQKISFVDLNQDGFVDIVESEKKEIINIPEAEWGAFASTKLWLRTKDSNYFYDLKAEKVLSKKQYKYLWDERRCIFSKVP